MRIRINNARVALPGLLAAGAITVAVAGCGGGGSAGSTAAAAAAVPTATGALVGVQSTSLGKILVNGKAMTIYQFANDKNGRSVCTGVCAQNWPFVHAPASLPASLAGVTGKLGTTTRADGAHQLTVSGHPLYTFAGDSAAGQTNGQGKTLNGGVWTVLSPSGASIASSAPAPAATSSPSGY
jgi:predicted lipoprotein with Yx(FWY)xxD motif